MAVVKAAMEKPRDQQDKRPFEAAVPKGREEITSESIKNANASGDGSMGRNESSIPSQEEDQTKEDRQHNAKEPY